MRSSTFQIILILSVFIPTLCFGQDKAVESSVKLRHVWRVGDVQKYRKTVFTKLNVDKKDRKRLRLEFTVTRELISYWTQTVLSVDKKGTATVKIQWTRFIESSNNDHPKAKHVLEIDTEDFGLIVRPNARQKLLDALLRMPLTVKIDKQGRMSKLQGLEKGIKEFLKREKLTRWEKETFVADWSNRRVLGDFQANFFTLPSQALKAQSKWTEVAKLSKIEFASNFEDWNYKLTDVKKLNNGSQVVVKGTSTQNPKKVDPQLNKFGIFQVELKVKSHKFRAVFDVTHGQFQESVSTREHTNHIKEVYRRSYRIHHKRTVTIKRVDDSKKKREQKD